MIEEMVFDPDEIDGGILDIVLKLRDAGFETIACCHGHGEIDTWISFHIDDEKNYFDFREKLSDWLVDNEFFGLKSIELKTDYSYFRSRKKVDNQWVVIGQGHKICQTNVLLRFHRDTFEDIPPKKDTYHKLRNYEQNRTVQQNI